MAALTATAQLRQWIRDQIANADEVALPELTREAINHFTAIKGWSTRFAEESFREMVQDVAAQTVSRTRGLISLGDTVTTKDGVERRGRRHSVFAGWLEHVGDRHIKLLQATREDLLVAATERLSRADVDIRIANLWRRLADGLEGGQTVGERYTPEEIEGIQRDLESGKGKRRTA